MKKIVFPFVFFIYCSVFVSCTEVKHHNCRSIDEQYKTMNHQDQKNLDRKKYRFKKPVPKQDKRETYREEEQ